MAVVVPKPRPPVIIALGDSLGEGYQMLKRAEGDQPAHLLFTGGWVLPTAEHLGASRGFLHNLCNSGASTRSILEGEHVQEETGNRVGTRSQMARARRLAAQAEKKGHPVLGMLLVGTNDLLQANHFTVDQFRSGLDQVCTELGKLVGKQAVIGTLIDWVHSPWVKDNVVPIDPFQQRLAAFNQIIQEVGFQHGFEVVDNTRHPVEFCADELHFADCTSRTVGAAMLSGLRLLQAYNPGWAS